MKFQSSLTKQLTYGSNQKSKILFRTTSKSNIVSKITLTTGTLATVLQFIYIRQNSYTLDSIMIPKTMIWEVNKQHIFFAFILTLGNFCGLLLYFFKRYLWAVVIVLISLLVIRYVYI